MTASTRAVAADCAARTDGSVRREPGESDVAGEPGDVAIVGGGPAGLAAAIRLAQDDRAVVVHEASAYPRHRVCGEFLSPDAQPALAALGLGDLCDALGAPFVEGIRATVSDDGRVLAEASRRLPAPARGVSRLDLDAALARAARAAGAEIRERSRIADAATLGARHVIVATGRQRRPFPSDRAPPRGWIALKAHVTGVALHGRTDLHFMRGAYVGLVDVVSGGARVVNVCALIELESPCIAARTDAARATGGIALFDSLASAAPRFAEQWRGAKPVDGSLCTSAGFDFALRGAARGDVLCSGDAAALLAPFTGDGQAMALRSGIAAAAAIGVGDGGGGGGGAARRLVREFGRSQRRRLLLARVLQRILLSPRLAALSVRAAARSDRLTSWVWRSTRGSG